MVEEFPGIYYVTGIKTLFPTQIIVSSKLGEEEHQWLKSLTSKMSKEVGERLVLSARNLSDKDDKENADSVLQLALAENPNLFKQLKEVPEMSEALNTLMKPELDAALSTGIAQGRAEGRAQGRAEGATELATAIKRLSRGDTVKALIEDGFSEEIVKSAQDIIDEF